MSVQLTVCAYSSNALFLLAPNYPLLSCVRDQGDAITILNSYTDIHNKGVLKRDRAVP